MSAAGMDLPEEHVTMLLREIAGGDAQAADRLLPAVYDELRRLARSRMSKERAGLTLEPTALVHEAYLRVIGSAKDQPWDHRGHFFAAAALAMRRILVERARHAKRLKHGGGRDREDLGEHAVRVDSEEQIDLIELDAALKKLELYDDRKAQIVSLRFFGGLSIEETAAAMGLSPATVKTEWAFARAWLRRAMVGARDPDATSGGGA
ncbi:MAG: sigma-70 family RNA polymerase sigma factor [Phycisphaeraceae bacterium]|nr:sigma-70 family RNA polymerase sigma factor [Phycisphaeraceae bacterium]